MVSWAYKDRRSPFSGQEATFDEMVGEDLLNIEGAGWYRSVLDGWSGILEILINTLNMLNYLIDICFYYL